MAGLSTAAPVTVPFLDFSRGYRAIREEVLAAIVEVCDSQRFILGPAVADFEAAASPHCGGTIAVGCASGTDALWLALAALNIGAGDAVLTSPFSFFATASSILRVGARPVFADIDPLTFNLDAGSVAAVLQRSAIRDVRAILPVHLYGQPANMTALDALALTHKACVVEDAAQAFGAAWDGTPAGALGDAAAFSFYPTKNLSAFGDAGLTTFRSPVAAEHAQMLRAHGMRRRYYHDEAGWNSRLDSVQAAVLTVKLRHIDSWNARRAEVAALYTKLFTQAGLAIAIEDCAAGARGVVPPKTAAGAAHVWHQYVIRVAAGYRDPVRAHLSDRGVQTEIYYPVPLHLQAALKPLGYKAGDFPESERAAAEVIALPIYAEITDAEVECVVGSLGAALRAQS